MKRPESSKADQASVRRFNMSAILRLLRERGTLARADLAKELGMTRNTASNIVSDLLDAGLVVETEYRRSGAGRPGLLLELSPHGGFAIGAEIDISRIIVVAVDLRGKILWRETAGVKAANTLEETCRTAEQLVEAGLAWGKAEGYPPLGIGLGLAGLVDAESGMLTYAPSLQWQDVPFRDTWEARFGLPVLLDNEANTSAMGYYTYSDRSNALNLAYLSIGVGMAAGLILEGRLFRGSDGYAGQAGHMKIRPDGEPCTCGDHGCWVTEVGMPALTRRHDAGSITPEEAAQALRLGESSVAAIADDMADMLGLGIVNLVNLFNLDTVILGGAMRPMLPFMLERAQGVVDQRALAQPRKNVRIKVSGRDDDAVFGAACLVLDRIISDPLPLLRGSE
jgi:predicted NBD/HSP70 family sugar kinase